MTVLKTKQFNGIQFGSVRPDFLDYNYIGDTTKTVDAQFILFLTVHFNLVTETSSREILQTY